MLRQAGRIGGGFVAAALVLLCISLFTDSDPGTPPWTLEEKKPSPTSTPAARPHRERADQPVSRARRDNETEKARPSATPSPSPTPTATSRTGDPTRTPTPTATPTPTKASGSKPDTPPGRATRSPGPPER
jgi:hypothetical protein